MAEAGLEEEARQCPIIRAWQRMPLLVARAAEGKLAQLGQEGLTRQCVSDNTDLLLPLVSELGALVYAGFVALHVSRLNIPGTRPSIHQVTDVVARFLYLCRPRGRKLPGSASTG